MKIYIYALCDPFTNEIRYIGKSIKPKERLTNQCNEKSNTHRCHWIQSILKRGRKPIQIILEELELQEDNGWQDAEKKWIKHGKDAGWRLVNSTDGGDGVNGLPEEIRKRMAKVWLGRKHKPESVASMRAKLMGSKHTPEHKEKIRSKMLGRKITWTDKISEANKKFSPKDIRTVKKMLRDGYMVKDIAKIFNVHRTTISKIKSGKYPN